MFRANVCVKHNRSQERRTKTIMNLGALVLITAHLWPAATRQTPDTNTSRQKTKDPWPADPQFTARACGCSAVADGRPGSQLVPSPLLQGNDPKASIRCRALGGACRFVVPAAISQRRLLYEVAVNRAGRFGRAAERRRDWLSGPGAGAPRSRRPGQHQC